MRATFSCRRFARPLVAALAAATVLFPAPAVAAVPSSTTTTAVPAIPLDEVDATFVTLVRAEVGSAQQAYALALRSQSRADGDATAAATRLNNAEHRVGDLETGQREAAAKIQAAHEHVRDLAVAAYVEGGPGPPVAALLGASSIADYTRREAIFTSVAQSSTAALETYVVARDNAAHETRLAFDALQAARAAKADADRTAAAAATGLQQAVAVVAQRHLLLTLATDAAAAGGSDIPAMALDAYQRAALTVQARGCRLAWWALAAVGRIESHHGRHHGAHLGPDGTLSPPILGPALDGTAGTIATPATAGGRYTGDPVWDHAVGPMQFVPTTWLRYGADGNGDGVADPNNIYDAALGAATYLCVSARDLDTPAGLRSAYFAYNHSDDYVAEVLGAAAAYEATDAAGDIPALSPVPLYLTTRR